MYLTGGSRRGTKIETPRGKTTRPLLSRVRRALFDSLKPWLTPGGTVLDLFAGTGALCAEAISRGARGGVAIDLDKSAVRAIQDNFKKLGVLGSFEVYHQDALRAVPLLGGRGLRFDVVLVAPPYWKGLQEKALGLVDAHDLLAPEGIVVVQRDRKEAYEPPPLERYALAKERVYGNTVMLFYQAKEVVAAAPAEPVLPEEAAEAASGSADETE